MSAEAYRSIASKTDTPLDEVLRVYNRVLYCVAIAQEQKEYDRIEMIEQAKDGIASLLLGLDLETGDIAENLASLYKYMLRLIGTDIYKGSVEDSNIRLKEIYNLLNTLLGAWRELK